MSVPMLPEDLGPVGSLEDSADGYLAMLRRIQEVSGRTAGQIAGEAGIPRSTAYRFIDPKNTSLPKSRDQLRAFLLACRLPGEEVAAMLRLWAQISGQTVREAQNAVTGVRFDRLSPTVMETIATTEDHWSELAPSIVVDRALNPEPSEKDADEIALEAIDPQDCIEVISEAGFGTSGPRSAVPIVTAVIQRRGGTTSRARRASRSQGCLGTRVRGMLDGKSMISVMLMVAICPMVLTVWSATILIGEAVEVLTAMAVVIGLVIGLSTQVRRAWWSRSLTRMRIGVAMPTGVGVGALAGVAALSTLVGVVTGFIVFTATPLWMAHIDLSRTISSAPGIFATMAAAWCAVGLGYASIALGLPATGATVVGIIGAAVVLNQLHVSVFDDARRPKPVREDWMGLGAPSKQGGCSDGGR